MTLKTFTKDYGAYKLARKLDINTVSLYQWSNYIALPKPETMRKLVKLSNGKLTYESMITDYLKNKSKRN